MSGSRHISHPNTGDKGGGLPGGQISVSPGSVSVSQPWAGSWPGDQPLPIPFVPGVSETRERETE